MKGLSAGLLGAISCIVFGPAAPGWAQQTLAVASDGGVYQDAERKAFYEPAAKALGITIKDYTLSDITDIRAQVKAGAVQWDVAEIWGGLCEQAAREGLTEPLDYSVIKTDGIPKELVHPNWIGITGYSTVLAYNKEKYGDNPPRTWADFFDTKKFPGTRALYAGADSAEIALLGDGVPMDKVYPIDADRAFKKLAEIKPSVVSWWQSGSQAMQLVKSQEADMLSIWVARIDAAIKDGAPYAYGFNQAIFDVDCLVVPKGAKNKELAMKAINLFVSPELQANLPQYVRYGPINQKAYETGKITPEMAKGLNTAPENFKQQLVLNKAWWVDNGQKMQERWDAFLQH